ncbi:MAG: hypothetical protein KatS3mg104_2983 [Phycisphaerae bacterium]|nr:MAG: hypothetical protein KatS3mg104_2983 [Phycisphaerae bacterium]
MISFSEAIREAFPEKKSLLQPPLWDEDRATPGQKELRSIFMTPAKKGPRILWLGGKGSGKTYGAAMVCAEFAVQNPYTIGAITSNTMNQISDAPLGMFVDMVKSVGGVTPVPRTEVRIEGKLYRNVLVLELGLDVYSFVLLRSFENIEMLEGVELDWCWTDEIQSTDFSSYKVVTGRIRGKRATSQNLPPRFFLGTGLITPHYKYHYTSQDNLFTHRIWSKTEDNKKNLSEEYMEVMRLTHSEEEIEMYLYGRPVDGVNPNSVFRFDPDVHVGERVPPEDRGNVIVSVDFNPAPVWASVWSKVGGLWRLVDEIEMWGATVYDLAYEISERGYTGGVIIGDATSNKRNTMSELTEFDVLEGELPGFVVVRGLLQNFNRGRITYQNPPVRDTVKDANFLLDNRRVMFYHSELESGGMAASVAASVWDYGTGKIDKRADKSADRRKPKTHAADTFRYFSYFVNRYVQQRGGFYEELLGTTTKKEVIGL